MCIKFNRMYKFLKEFLRIYNLKIIDDIMSKKRKLQETEDAKVTELPSKKRKVEKHYNQEEISNSNQNENNKKDTNNEYKVEQKQSDNTNNVNNKNEQTYDSEGGDKGYESFEQWTAQYITENEERFGVGYCWNYLDYGECMDKSCTYKHRSPPQFQSTKAKNADTIKSTMQIDFGKHQGKHLHQLPRHYVVWMKKKNIFATTSEYGKEMKRVWPDVFK
eukprot:452612_1